MSINLIRTRKTSFCNPVTLRPKVEIYRNGVQVASKHLVNEYNGKVQIKLAMATHFLLKPDKDPLGVKGAYEGITRKILI